MISIFDYYLIRDLDSPFRLDRGFVYPSLITLIEMDQNSVH